MSDDPLVGPGSLWLEATAGDAPDAVEEILTHCSDHVVSDVVISADEEGYPVTARQLGTWQPVTQFPVELGRRCVAHIKALSNLDITEKRRPQDGRWDFTRPDGGIVDIRVSILPTLHGEDLTLRLLRRDMGLLSIDSLGLVTREYNHLLRMLNEPGGLILVTGPTGAGKTTTLYACVAHLNDGKRKINTIEDPIEYHLNGVRQSQVNPAVGLGFAELLRTVLRQAPDVILVGEIRDHETAHVAARAALSGHLVLATMHAPMAAAAVETLLNLGIHPHLLSSCLTGVLSQRLVRTLNPATRQEYDVAMVGPMFDEIRSFLGPGQGEILYGPGAEPSYTGRTGVFEVMPVTPEIRKLIMIREPTSVIRHQAIEEGMIDIRQSALLAMARGETSVEEVFRVVPSEYLAEDS